MWKEGCRLVLFRSEKDYRINKQNNKPQKWRDGASLPNESRPLFLDYLEEVQDTYMVHWIVEVGYHLFKDERGGGHIKVNINKDYQSYSMLDLNRGTKKASF